MVSICGLSLKMSSFVSENEFLCLCLWKWSVCLWKWIHFRIQWNSFVSSYNPMRGFSKNHRASLVAASFYPWEDWELNMPAFKRDRGRNQETYGYVTSCCVIFYCYCVLSFVHGFREDPFLTSSIGLAYTTGLQEVLKWLLFSSFHHYTKFCGLRMCLLGLERSTIIPHGVCLCKTLHGSRKSILVISQNWLLGFSTTFHPLTDFSDCWGYYDPMFKTREW